MYRRNILIAMAVGSVSCISSSVVLGDEFTNPANWASYDFPDDNSTDGFGGACYDNAHECIYFAPWVGSATITRFCKSTDHDAFADPGFWESCDVGSLVGALGGYNGVAFDGRYVYFAPYTTPSDDYHGEVLRHDTTLAFCDAASWATFDAIANASAISGADRPGGFAGATYADGYVYFSPGRRYNGQPNGTANGEVLRYNTNCDFSDPACWEAFDYSKSATCINDPNCFALGYAEPCFDGRYVYFSPNARGNVFHGEVLRYDTAGNFLNEASWSTFDYGDHCTPGVDCTDPDGYTGCVVDGNGIVYFAQENNHSTTDRGEILRYDSNQPFEDPASWATYDASHNQPDSKGGYEGVAYDGSRFVYFVPNSASPSWDSAHGEVLRLDTLAAFDQPDAWAIYDYGDDPNGCALQSGCSDPDGYHNAVFDGRYVYFSPSYNGTELHGEVLRYDTRTAIPAVGTWGLAIMSLLGLTCGTVVARRPGSQAV